jgi:hypothetical protein
MLESQTQPAVAARETAQAATIAFLAAFLDDRVATLETTLDELTDSGNAVQRDF